MNAAWARGVVLLRENRQLLCLMAGMFILLPSAMITFALPENSALAGPIGVMFDPAASEAARLRASEAIATMLAPFIAWSGIVTVVQHIGYGAMMALMGRARPTVGQAIVIGLKAILPVIAALIVFFIGLYGVLLLTGLIFLPLGQAASAFLGSIAGVAIALFMTARLSLTLPAMALERQFNPFKALLRSWRLTARGRGNVFGFWMLLIVAYAVILILVSAISNVLAAIVGDTTGGTLIVGLIGGLYAMAWGMLISALAVAMFQQLAGPDSAEVAEVFE